MQKRHPYLEENFAAVHETQSLTLCQFAGSIPRELAGGQYVRNGGNPLANTELGRDFHFFDGDGMLSGVLFRRQNNGSIQPEFVSQFVLTDVYLSAATTSVRAPILPSITTLVNPLSRLVTIIARILRALLLVFLSHLPGSVQAIKKMSISNTNILYHDGRALATCESGPPMRVSLPGLETVGWFNGAVAEGEPAIEKAPEERFGGDGLLSFMKDWTTAHPKVDPETKEMLLFHSSFFAPYVNYSVLPSTRDRFGAVQQRLVNAPVPGVKAPKMMHDFGVSLNHTIIIDLPLSLDPRNLARSLPVVSYDPQGRSRFGVFPRWNPTAVRWFESDPCCIFHVANCWNEFPINRITNFHQPIAVNMLACRLTSAAMVYSAGNIAAPITAKSSSLPRGAEGEECRLYYYRFSLTSSCSIITHQFALAAIPFEFPSIVDSLSMKSCRYVFGCSVTKSSFGAALGGAAKIDCLVKIDTQTLISRAEFSPPTPITGCVDTRNASEILASIDPYDPIKIFKLPPGYYAQEPRFVHRDNGDNEDDGWILTYVFDEQQLGKDGMAGRGCRSELWVIDAKGMKDVVCKVKLPRRVPYGLHGKWFSEAEILGQRPIEGVRTMPTPKRGMGGSEEEGLGMEIWVKSSGMGYWYGCMKLKCSDALVG